MDEKNKTIKLLLIEDNPGDARLMKEMLTDGMDSPFTVEFASCLAEGLEQLDKANFDVIILDLMLPDSYGLETFVKVNEKAPRSPIVVTSGLNDEALAVNAVQRGAQDYLVKGHADSGAMRRSLRYAIERKQIQENLRIKDRVVESSINSIAIADLQGKLTYANHAFLDLWGYESIDEVKGKSIEEFSHRFTEALWITETALSRGSWQGKMRGQRKDGVALDLQLSAFIVSESDEVHKPMCLVFSFVDITELSQLRRRLESERSFAGIIGCDAKMLELFDTIREVAEVDAPVLLQGESGTGKELVAIAIHNQGTLSNRPFVPVNCGALPEGVLESELFGHVKGAFTGAIRDRKGRFELADGGTIFLDEIGELPREMQVKLLRVLQDGKFQPVGSEKTMKVDVRVISATNKNLAEEVSNGTFREDLFYRLCVVPIYMPPLRERRKDIPLLANHFLREALAEMHREKVVLSTEAIDFLMEYNWPGNVRELENAMQYALMKCKGDQVLPEHFSLRDRSVAFEESTQDKKQRKTKIDTDSVTKALEETGGNKIAAAEKLGVSRATLYRHIQDGQESNKTGAR
ncbi:MAG: sigma-54-dependent Fis family transcriptional regulator [Planctomycetes bacterium]|nr:sigma-54-dependent Fis family transcriptional regulator [Planctomycetota bacterium]MCK5473754.1 sigma-54-dependent Fis family transcriptional regulator [Planctomycetota bacterium]